MNIIWPTDEEKEVVDAIRAAIGRPVIFVAEIKTDCPACNLDPITDTSTNPFCLVCSGVGYLIVYSGTTISGHITQGPTDYMQWFVGGQLKDGECRVQIEYTPGNITVVDNAVYAMIDGTKFDVRKKILRGVKAINRILVDLIQRE